MDLNSQHSSEWPRYQSPPQLSLLSHVLGSQTHTSALSLAWLYKHVHDLPNHWLISLIFLCLWEPKNQNESGCFGGWESPCNQGNFHKPFQACDPSYSLPPCSSLKGFPDRQEGMRELSRAIVDLNFRIQIRKRLKSIAVE